MQKYETVQQLMALADKSINNFNEENVKIHVVIKLLNILGHSDNLDLEHNYGTNRPDIIINGLEMPVIIEVKGANENIDSHISQIQKYSYDLNSCLSILTNGKSFYFFSPFWKQKSFENRIIVSLNLEDLRYEKCTEILISLLHMSLDFKQMCKNIEHIENEVLTKKEKVKENENRVSELKNNLKLLNQNYPNIDDLKRHINYLDSKIKTEIENYLDIEDEIRAIENENLLFKKQIPAIRGIIRESKLPSISGMKNYESREKISATDFSMGIADEVINIRELQKGNQIIICRNNKKSNDFVFLLPKTTFKSKFKPSEKGRMLMNGLIECNTTKYIAKIEYLSVPGNVKGFWQDLYDEEEFDLWDIEGGPFKYFNESKKSEMLVWIFRVYEIPFEIKINEDFRPPHMLNSSIINPNILKKIQSGFKNGDFTPVLNEDEFERRKKKITQIADKWIDISHDMY